MSESNEKQDLGKLVQDFCLPAISGETVGLSSFLVEHRAAVVVFWSATCSHCVRYDTYLNDFSGRYPDMALLTVAARSNETMELLHRTAAERNLGFPILHDQNRDVAHRWQVSQTPRAFLLDANLCLRYRGAIDNFTYPTDPEHEAYLDIAVQALLAGEPIQRNETASFGCPIESVYYAMPKPLKGVPK